MIDGENQIILTVCTATIGTDKINFTSLHFYLIMLFKLWMCFIHGHWSILQRSFFSLSFAAGMLNT